MVYTEHNKACLILLRLMLLPRLQQYQVKRSRDEQAEDSRASLADSRLGQRDGAHSAGILHNGGAASQGCRVELRCPAMTWPTVQAVPCTA